MSDNQYLLQVEHLKQYFPVQKGFRKIPLKAVDDISFAIKPGETLGLVGESGCGKTTVGRTLLRLYQPTAGKIIFDGDVLFDSGEQYDENGKIVYGTDETIYGKDALQYVRYRGYDFDAASYRLEKQKVYLKALGAKMLAQVKSNPASAVNLFQAVSPYMVTDISLSEITYLADNLGGYSLDNKIYSLKGETTVGDQGFEEFHYDEGALYDLMMQVFYEEVKGQGQEKG